MLNATELAVVLHLIKKHSGGGSVITDGIHYKGAVNYYANLPTDAEEGDAYTVKYAGSTGTVPDGTEYVWGKLNGTLTWIDFLKDSYTKAEVDKKIADSISGKVDQSEFDELSDKVEKIIKLVGVK